MQVVMSLRFLRNWGYAPALLLEGVASAPEFCDLYAKDNLKNSKLPKLSTLGVTRKYRALDRTTSSMAAGSFVTYLLRTRGLGKLREWYQQSTDLTVPQMFEQVYGTVSGLGWRMNGTAILIQYPYQSRCIIAILVMHRRLCTRMTRCSMRRPRLAATATPLTFGSTLANLYFTYGDYARRRKTVSAI